MSILKKLSFGTTVSAILTIILGILFCVEPVSTSAAFVYICGAVLLAVGIFNVLHYFRSDEPTLLPGVLYSVIAVYIMTHISTAQAIMALLFSVFILSEGVSDIERSLMLKKIGVPTWWLSLAVGILLVLAGLNLIFDPFGAFLSATLWTGITLITTGITTLIILQMTRDVRSTINGK